MYSKFHEHYFTEWTQKSRLLLVCTPQIPDAAEGRSSCSRCVVSWSSGGKWSFCNETQANLQANIHFTDLNNILQKLKQEVQEYKESNV